MNGCLSQEISTSTSNGRKRRRANAEASEVPSGDVSSADLNHVCMIAFPNVIFYIPMHVLGILLHLGLAGHSLTNLPNYIHTGSVCAQP